MNPIIKKYGIFVLYMLIYVPLFMSHELWRDEIHNWLIVQDVDSISAFFNARINDGHPIGWHLFMLPMPNLMWARVLSAFVYVVLLFEIYRKAPFTTINKGLFLFGYFTLFEFGVMLRPYGLIALLSLYIVLLFQRKGSNIIGIAVLLGILANLHLCGAIISGVILLYFILSGKHTEESKKDYWLAGTFLLLFYLLFGADFLLQDLEWAKTSTNTQIPSSFSAEWIIRNLAVPFKVFFPIPNLTTSSFWNTNFLEGLTIFKISETVIQALQALGSILLLGWIIIKLRTQRIVLTFFVLGIFSIFTLTTFIYHGQLRHQSLYFIVLIIVYWLADEKKNLKPLITVVFIVQVLAGIYVGFQDLTRPFSNAKNVADYMRKENVEYTLTGAMDYTLSPVSGYLDKEYYSCQSERFESYVKWDRKHYVELSEVLEQSDSLSRRTQKKVFILLSKPYANYTKANECNQIKRITSFENAIVDDENYDLFKLK